MIYRTEGVCSKEIHFEIADGIITKVAFVNGCNGSLKGIAELVKGRKPADVIPLLEGVRCNSRPTSCPDQLAAALKEVL